MGKSVNSYFNQVSLLPTGACCRFLLAATPWRPRGGTRKCPHSHSLPACPPALCYPQRAGDVPTKPAELFSVRCAALHICVWRCHGGLFRRLAHLCGWSSSVPSSICLPLPLGGTASTPPPRLLPGHDGPNEPRGHQSGGCRALFASPPFPHGRNKSRAMPGEALQRGAPRGHHSPLPTSPPPAPPLTCSRLSLPPTTPWQVLRANPSSYAGQKWRDLYVLFELRSELPRDAGGGGVARGEAARAVRNEGRSTVRRGPVGPCRSVLHHKFACLACSHSCIMIMVDIPSSWQRISNRYERRGSISGNELPNKVL